MGHNDYMDFDLHERLEALVELGAFHGKAKGLGIARFAADNGLAALSSLQMVVWNNNIVPVLQTPINKSEELQQALQRDREDEDGHF